MKAKMILEILNEVSQISSLWNFFIQEENLSIDSLQTLELTKKCLMNLKFLLILRIGDVNVEKKDLDIIQELIDKHNSLLLFELLQENVFNTRKADLRLKNYITTMLRYRYDRYELLNECPVLFMGDGKVGKTSTVNRLFDRRFLFDRDSTLVLNDIDIFSINPLNYNWNSITKHELSVQRVKNILPRAIYFNVDPKQEVQTKYKFNFEDELLTRTIADDSFVEALKTQKSIFTSQEFYFRVYDFGGQEVFSSVHSIFMTSVSIYFLVFNLMKVSEKDLNRMKFWCESVLENAPEGKVILIGTYLRRYRRKNGKDENLQTVNETISDLLQSLSSTLFVLEDENTVFFPIENSTEENSIEVQKIKDRVSSIVSGEARIEKEDFLNFKIATSWVLFLDNCREESNIMSVKQFEEKAVSCGFDLEEIGNMLEFYTEVGLLCYFEGLDLEKDENFIFFAPSYLAQALGKFIRDASFHQLAFRVPSDKFLLYRIYVDSAKISRELFFILLKEYTEKEIKYVLQLAFQTAMLIRLDDEEETYILPELLPPLDPKLKTSFKRDVDFIFAEYLRLFIFVLIVIVCKKHEDVTQTFLYKGFARLIFGTKYVIDVFVSSDTTISFGLVQGKDKDYLNKLLEVLVPLIRSEIPAQFEIVERTVETRKENGKPKKKNNFIKNMLKQLFSSKASHQDLV
eukprot:snap_masked-scaffold_3-processed-gene-21.34-mRNA-1 protein AED:1.00 eAED:1.00 QI:0/0/0/0/1/1/3/0/685